MLFQEHSKNLQIFKILLMDKLILKHKLRGLKYEFNGFNGCRAW